MLEHKKTNPFIALLGAAALLMTPALAVAAPSSPEAASASVEAPAPAPVTETAEAAPADEAAGGHGHGEGLTIATMFNDAHIVVKIVMISLVLMSVISWVILIMKVMEFGGLNRTTTRFLEEFRGARSIADINRIATSDDFAGNPLADMAAVATDEVQTSKQAGLSVSGEHRDTTIGRAEASVHAVQAGINKRLSGGQVFLATTGSTAVFIGLFGTVYGIMNSFIGIANTNTTNLAVVAPGIAEALLATGIGLVAAIPAVIMYNVFNSTIAAYGNRSEQFNSELMNTLSRQLDKGV